MAGFGITRYQNYRISKIDFIIWDSEHENVANLSREQLGEYLRQCGAHVETSALEWSVRYYGLFRRKTWTLSFATHDNGALQQKEGKAQKLPKQ